MRNLGKGQSVVFCVPEEIQTKINTQRSKPKNTSIEVLHVLAWAISETWEDLRRSMPIWATQGRRFENHKNLLHGARTTIGEAKQFLEDEAQSIDQLYRPRLQDRSGAQFEGWDTSKVSIQRIVNRCQEFDTMNFNAANLQEEQERELAHQIEEERQKELPLPMEAETHKVSNGLRRLIQTGYIQPNSDGLLPAFRELKSCSAAKLFDVSQFPVELLVTADFVRTVKRPSNFSSTSYVSDSYQRPVQWVLSIRYPNRPLVIISPFEANELLSDIRQSSYVTMHLYAPRINLAYQPLDGLDLYTLGEPYAMFYAPRTATMQLNLYAGQLYLRSFDEYMELCQYLGLAWTAAKGGERQRADGFVMSSVGKWGLKDSPINFLKVFLTKVRLQCEGIEKTHMGKIVDGTPLEKNDIE
jgi:hypothetical protein